MERNNTNIRTKDETLVFLKESGLEVHHHETHEKLDTVQQGLDKFKTVELKEQFVFAKNLFLKNKAGGFYLLTVHPVSF